MKKGFLVLTRCVGEIVLINPGTENEIEIRVEHIDGRRGASKTRFPRSKNYKHSSKRTIKTKERK